MIFEERIFRYSCPAWSLSDLRTRGENNFEFICILINIDYWLVLIWLFFVILILPVNLCLHKYLLNSFLYFSNTSRFSFFFKSLLFSFSRLEFFVATKPSVNVTPNLFFNFSFMLVYMLLVISFKDSFLVIVVFLNDFFIFYVCIPV